MCKSSGYHQLFDNLLIFFSEDSYARQPPELAARPGVDCGAVILLPSNPPAYLPKTWPGSYWELSLKPARSWAEEVIQYYTSITNNSQSAKIKHKQ